MSDEDEENLIWKGTADEGAWNVKAEAIESNPYRCVLIVTRAADDKEILHEEVDNDLDLWTHMVIGAIDHFESQREATVDGV